MPCRELPHQTAGGMPNQQANEEMEEAKQKNEDYVPPDQWLTLVGNCCYALWYCFSSQR